MCCFCCFVVFCGRSDSPSRCCRAWMLGDAGLGAVRRFPVGKTSKVLAWDSWCFMVEDRGLRWQLDHHVRHKHILLWTQILTCLCPQVIVRGPSPSFPPLKRQIMTHEGLFSCGASSLDKARSLEWLQQRTEYRCSHVNKATKVTTVPLRPVHSYTYMYVPLTNDYWVGA